MDEREEALERSGAGSERASALDCSAGSERSSALERGIQALARRDHSAATLAAKLERAGVSEQAREEALETLEQAGYVDDTRFARDRAAHLAAKGYGDEWIRGDLEAQGVAPEAVDPAIETLEPERERAVAECERLGGGVKAVKTLARRGFSEDSVEPILARLHGTPVEE